MAASVRHETRALLRAHLSAAASYGHLTRHCRICHHLLRLAMDAPPRPVETAATGTEAPADAAGGQTPDTAVPGDEAPAAAS